MIQREALAAKEMPPDLNILPTTVVTLVNYIEIIPLKTKIFSALCTEFEKLDSPLHKI